MSKQDVIVKLGNPESMSAVNNAEYMVYRYHISGQCGASDDYYVRLSNGKVDAYGRINNWKELTGKD